MYHSVSAMLLLFYLCIVRHLTLSAASDAISNKHETQYIIVYMTSDSGLSPILFETSFNVFGASLRSVIAEALPSLSSSFNMSQINLWCLPDNNDITMHDLYGSEEDLYSSFYIKVDYDSNENDILLSILNRMNNDLFPQLMVENIKTIDTHSPLIDPQHFKFEIYDIIIAQNETFIVEESDCISYLIENNKLQTSSIANNAHIAAVVINHDDDDFVEFLFYGFTVHCKIFVIYSAICVVIGMSICCAIVCFHINLMERKRMKIKKLNKRRRRRRMRSRNSYFSSRSAADQTPSCVGSITDLTQIAIDAAHDEDLMHIYDDDDDDMIAIIRSPPCATKNTAISRRNLGLQKVKSNSVTIDSEQSQLIRQQYMKNKLKRAESCRGYDKLHHFDVDEDELKQEEELFVDEDEFQGDSLETEKIVTVHVHHHYNPNGANIANVPDLPPFEEHDNNNNNDYVALHSPPSEHHIANILAISAHKDACKEPSKSQREGFSPFTVQQVIRKSVVSQQEDHMSDSELMYLPGPAADDTPGNCKNTPHDLDI